MMIDAALYARVNAPVIVRNCICEYLWNGKPFENTINKSLDYTREYGYCPVKMLDSEIKKVMVGAFESLEGFKKYLRRLMEHIPGRCSFARCIKEEFDSNLTVDDLYVRVVHEARRLLAGV